MLNVVRSYGTAASNDSGAQLSPLFGMPGIRFWCNDVVSTIVSCKHQQLLV